MVPDTLSPKNCRRSMAPLLIGRRIRARIGISMAACC
jgi:hypothetical protein